MIYALADLESAVVSLCIDFLPSKYSSDMSCLFQVTFEDRKLNQSHDTHHCVDCTDYRIQQKGPGLPHTTSKASRHCAMMFQGEIKWLNGSYPCKDWPDINILEADDGYVGVVHM